MPPVEVTYTLTKEDLWGFQRFHMSRKGKWRWLTRAGTGLFVALWVLQLWLVIRLLIEWRFAFGLGPRVWSLIFAVHQHTLVNFLIISLFLAYLLWGQKFLSVRQVTDASLLSMPKRMRIGPQGVEVVTERERVQRAWGDIRDIDSDKECLYLYMTPTNALVVPKRAFANAETAQAFEGQARAFRANPYTAGSTDTASVEAAAVWPPPPQAEAFDAPTPAPELDDVPGALQVRYVTRKADFWRSQVFFLSRRPAALLSVFVPYALGASIWLFPRLPTLTALLWTVVGAAAATLLTLAWTTRSAINQRFARFADGRPCRTIIRPDLLCDVTPEGRTNYYWRDVQAVRVRAGDIFVLSKGHRGVVIPRTAFPDLRATREFVAAIERFQQEAQEAAPPVGVANVS